MISMCLLYVSLRSRVNPIIFVLMFMGSVMLSICSFSGVLYSTGSGVKRVHAVFSGLRMRLPVCVNVCIFDWMFVLLCLCHCVLMLWCMRMA